MSGHYSRQFSQPWLWSARCYWSLAAALCEICPLWSWNCFFRIVAGRCRCTCKATSGGTWAGTSQDSDACTHLYWLQTIATPLKGSFSIFFSPIFIIIASTLSVDSRRIWHKLSTFVLFLRLEVYKSRLLWWQMYECQRYHDFLVCSFLQFWDTLRKCPT